MNVLADCATVEDLIISVPLSSIANEWMRSPLKESHVFETFIKKSSGGYRCVVKPKDDSLARLHKRLKDFFDKEVLRPHPAVHGFVRKRGHYSNACQHLNANAILTIDLADYFESITSIEVETTLRDFGATKEVARAITNVCSYNKVLATGFSTSPVISNMFFLKLDNLLSNFADDAGLVYTRYADDLTFSGDEVGDDHLEQITEILHHKRLKVNRKKLRFQRRGKPQVVTGYVVAHPDHPRLSRYFKRRLRQDLYYAEKFGIEHQAEVLNIEPEDLIEKLKGQINYLMGSERESALSLRKKYANLLGR